MKCLYCYGKGNASVFANHSFSSDFGRTFTTPKKFIAYRPCRHCLGTGQCRQKDPPCPRCHPKVAPEKESCPDPLDAD